MSDQPRRISLQPAASASTPVPDRLGDRMGDSEAGGASTTGSPKKRSKKKVPQPTMRFNLDLGDPNENKCHEFNYLELVRTFKRNRRDVPLPGPSDPFASEDDDEVAAIARKMEEKYGSGKVAWDDDIDRGQGYDEEDSFVDNGDAYDEVVPLDLNTKHGGFYINSGSLEFADADPEQDIKLESSAKTNSREKRVTLEVFPLDDDESADQVTDYTASIKEPKFQSPEKLKKRRKRKRLGSPDDDHLRCSKSLNDRGVINTEKRKERRAGFVKKKTKRIESSSDDEELLDKQNGSEISIKEPLEREKDSLVKNSAVKQADEHFRSPKEISDIKSSVKDRNNDDVCVAGEKMTMKQRRQLDDAIESVVRKARKLNFKKEEQEQMDILRQQELDIEREKKEIDRKRFEKEKSEKQDRDHQVSRLMQEKLKEQQQVHLPKTPTKSDLKDKNVDVHRDTRQGGPYDTSRATAVAAVRPASLALDHPIAAVIPERAESVAPIRLPDATVRLPERTPTELERLIGSITAIAREKDLGKSKFFQANGVNDILLQIDRLARQSLPCSQRTQLYAYLTAHLPCSKETLLKRIKKLRLDEEDMKVKEPMLRFKTELSHLVVDQLARYRRRCEDVGQKPCTGSDSEEDGVLIRRVFEWTDALRRLFREVVSLKLRTYEVSKLRATSAEDYVKNFFEIDMIILWPRGWMNARTLLRMAHEDQLFQRSKIDVFNAVTPNVGLASPARRLSHMHSASTLGTSGGPLGSTSCGVNVAKGDVILTGSVQHSPALPLRSPNRQQSLAAPLQHKDSVSASPIETVLRDSSLLDAMQLDLTPVPSGTPGATSIIREKARDSLQEDTPGTPSTHSLHSFGTPQTTSAGNNLASPNVRERRNSVHSTHFTVSEAAKSASSVLEAAPHRDESRLPPSSKASVSNIYTPVSSEAEITNRLDDAMSLMKAHSSVVSTMAAVSSSSVTVSDVSTAHHLSVITSPSIKSQHQSEQKQAHKQQSHQRALLSPLPLIETPSFGDSFGPPLSLLTSSVLSPATNTLPTPTTAGTSTNVPSAPSLDSVSDVASGVGGVAGPSKVSSLLSASLPNQQSTAAVANSSSTSIPLKKQHSATPLLKASYQAALKQKSSSSLFGSGSLTADVSGASGAAAAGTSATAGTTGPATFSGLHNQAAAAAAAQAFAEYSQKMAANALSYTSGSSGPKSRDTTGAAHLNSATHSYAATSKSNITTAYQHSHQHVKHQALSNNQSQPASAYTGAASGGTSVGHTQLRDTGLLGTNSNLNLNTTIGANSGTTVTSKSGTNTPASHVQQHNVFHQNQTPNCTKEPILASQVIDRIITQQLATNSYSNPGNATSSGNVGSNANSPLLTSSNSCNPSVMTSSSSTTFADGTVAAGSSSGFVTSANNPLPSQSVSTIQRAPTSCASGFAGAVPTSGSLLPPAGSQIHSASSHSSAPQLPRAAITPSSYNIYEALQQQQTASNSTSTGGAKMPLGGPRRSTALSSSLESNHQPCKQQSQQSQRQQHYQQAGIPHQHRNSGGTVLEGMKGFPSPMNTSSGLTVSQYYLSSSSTPTNMSSTIYQTQSTPKGIGQSQQAQRKTASQHPPSSSISALSSPSSSPGRNYSWGSQQTFISGQQQRQYYQEQDKMILEHQRHSQQESTTSKSAHS